MRRRQVQQSRVFHDLSSLIFNLISSPPPPIDFSDRSPPSSLSSTSPPPRRTSPQQITPVGFASLMLGMSVAMMLCGSVTFFIGFIMMPWVLGLAMFFYFVGIISSLSMLARAVLCHLVPPPSPPPKDVSAWKLM